MNDDGEEQPGSGGTPQAVIYLRVSSPSQVNKDYDKEGLSLPAQRQACMKKAAKLGAAVVEEFVEPGVSGGSIQKRKAFKAMLRTIAERGDIDYVIVWSVSRWARDQEDHWVARGLIRRSGARLVSVKEQIGGESSSEIMMEGVMAAVAAGRRIEIAEDVRRGITRKAEVGGTPFRAPIGYVNVSTVRDGREIRDVVLDPERAPLVVETFQLYATESYALEELAALMEARGLRSRPTRNTPAQPLTPNRLSSMLRNEYYVGSVVVAGKSYRGRHEPLVSEALFERVQEILEARRQNGARAWKHHHYLAGTLFCGNCGARLLYSRNRGKLGKQYEYFLCVNKQHGDCNQPYHRLEDVETAVEQFYGRVTLTEQERIVLRDELLASLEKLAQVSDKDLTDAERTLARIEAQERKLLDAHYADSIRPDLFHDEQRRLRRERVAVEQLRERLEADLGQVAESVDVAVELTTDPQAAYRRADARLRNLMNRGYFRALYVDSGEITDAELQPVFEQLMEVWHTIKPRPQRRRTATLQSTSKVRRRRGQEAQPLAGFRPGTQRNPRAFPLGGSKVEGMVEAGGIEPPTPPCKGGVFPLALRPRGGSSLNRGGRGSSGELGAPPRHLLSSRAMLATAAAVVLGFVLLGSAAAKLAAPARTRAALATFGLRSARTRAVAWGAAVAAELALGAGVALGLDAAAYAAAALMLAFAALLARALRAGRAGQPCGCLGARSRVTPPALGRTLTLAVAFALLPLVPDTDPSAEAWLAIGLGIALAAIATLAFLLLALAREVGELRLALPPQLPLEIDGEGPARGSRAPVIDRFVPAPSNRFALAVFSSEGCPMCRALEPAVAALQRDPLLAVEVFDEHEDQAVWRAHAIPGSPYALVLSLDGTVLAQGTFNRARQLEALVAAGEAREREPVHA